MARTLNDIKGNAKEPRLGDLVKLYEFPDKKKVRLRLVGPMWINLWYWFTIRTKSGKKVSIPKLCLDYDAVTDTFIKDECPFRASGQGRENKEILYNAIIRSQQEDMPRKPKPPSEKESQRKTWMDYKGYWRDGKNSTAWSPVEVVRISSSLLNEIQAAIALEDEDNIDIADPEKGWDIVVRYDKDQPPTSRFKVQLVKQTPLTKEEKKYLLWRLDVLKPMALAAAKKEMKSLAERLVTDDDDKDDRKNKKKSKYDINNDNDNNNDDEDSINENNDQDDDQDDDDRPVKKKVKKKSSVLKKLKRKKF